MFVLILLSGFICSLVYVRPTQNLAYVRSGYGGETILLTNPGWILPILHKSIPVNLATVRITIGLVDHQALLTKDRLRANVEVDFYVFIKAEEASIAAAARQLGVHSNSVHDLKDILQSKFVDALRTAAAEFELEQMQTQRSEFVTKIESLCTEPVLKNGLTLESVSITHLTQTSKEFFNPDNVFDAEGLTKLVKLTQTKRKIRTEIEQQTTIDITKNKIESECLILELNNEKDTLKLQKDNELAILDATERAEAAKVQLEMQLRERQSEIDAEQAREHAEHIKELKSAEILLERSKAQAKASLARAEAVQAGEQIQTARELEKAERKRQIAMLEAGTEAKRNTMIISARIGEFYQAHAEGIQSLISAFRSLSESKIPPQVQLEILSHLPKVSHNIKHPTSASIQTKTLALQNLLEDSQELLGNVDTSNGSSNSLREVLDDARQSLLAEAISSLNEFKGGDDIAPDIHREEIDARTPT